MNDQHTPGNEPSAGDSNKLADELEALNKGINGLMKTPAIPVGSEPAASAIGKRPPGARPADRGYLNDRSY